VGYVIELAGAPRIRDIKWEYLTSKSASYLKGQIGLSSIMINYVSI